MSYAYDSYSRLNGVTVGTKKGEVNKTTYEYDRMNRLILQKSVDKNGTVIAQYAYTLGKNGERMKVIESGACGSVETSYDYDKANRLVKEVIEIKDEKTVYIYAYDAIGNRILKSENGGKDLICSCPEQLYKMMIRKNERWKEKNL